MNEKVSVIVPFYNMEAYLKRCVDSLLAQTHDNIEIIMADDCSTDGSPAIAHEYEKRNPQKCVYVKTKQNGGASAARNCGLKVATGEWIAFCDSDDWVTNDYIFAMYELAQRDKSDIVVGTDRYRYYSGGKIKIARSAENINTESPHKEKVAMLDNACYLKLFKRELFFLNDISFPEDIRRGEDISTSVPLYTKAQHISILHRPLYYYFQRRGSISNTNYRNIDLSFYPKTIHRMYEKSSAGFEKELEYRAVSELVYGMTTLMVYSGRSNADISKHLDWFDSEHPGWTENPYLSVLPAGKRLFIRLASQRKLSILRTLIKVWNVMQKSKMQD